MRPGQAGQLLNCQISAPSPRLPPKSTATSFPGVAAFGSLTKLRTRGHSQAETLLAMRLPTLNRHLHPRPATIGPPPRRPSSTTSHPRSPCLETGTSRRIGQRGGASHRGCDRFRVQQPPPPWAAVARGSRNPRRARSTPVQRPRLRRTLNAPAPPTPTPMLTFNSAELLKIPPFVKLFRDASPGGGAQPNAKGT